MAVMETHLKAGPKLPDGAVAPESPSTERLRLSRVGAARVAPTFAEDVRRGLTASPKFLYPKYFYDERGSLLFEAITVLPEYYPTRAEAEILRTHASEIVATLGGPVWLLELGSGDGQKTRLVIEALLARQGKLEYVPVLSSHWTRRWLPPRRRSARPRWRWPQPLGRSGRRRRWRGRDRR